MFGKAISGLVVGGLLVAGSTGVAAAQTTHSTTKSHKHTTFNCAKAPDALARIAKVDSRISTALPKLQQAEAAATQAGNSTKAQKIAARIDRLQKTQTKAGQLQSRITAACPTTPSAG